MRRAGSATAALSGGRERPRSAARGGTSARRPTNSRKSGCGRVGRDRSSGWNWPATKNGWSGSSMISVEPAVVGVAREHEPVRLERLVVGRVDLPPMPVALFDDRPRRRPRRPWCPARGGRAARRAASTPPRSVTSFCSGSRSITACGRGRVELARVRALEAAHVAGELDHRALQAQADPEERHAALAREPHRGHLALDAPDAEPAGDQHAVDVVAAPPRSPARRGRRRRPTGSARRRRGGTRRGRAPPSPRGRRRAG